MMGNTCGCGRLSKMAFGLAIGVTSGLYLLLLALASMYWGIGSAVVEQTASFYSGYGASVVGGLWGGLWGLIEGFIVGFVMAAFYNFFSRCCKKICCKSQGSCG